MGPGVLARCGKTNRVYPSWSSHETERGQQSLVNHPPEASNHKQNSASNQLKRPTIANPQIPPTNPSRSTLRSHQPVPNQPRPLPPVAGHPRALRADGAGPTDRGPTEPRHQGLRQGNAVAKGWWINGWLGGGLVV